eukprot:scaffold284604_cov17-Tisochrysis_lutea.AAC.2
MAWHLQMACGMHLVAGAWWTLSLNCVLALHPESQRHMHILLRRPRRMHTAPESQVTLECAPASLSSSLKPCLRATISNILLLLPVPLCGHLPQ